MHKAVYGRLGEREGWGGRSHEEVEKEAIDPGVGRKAGGAAAAKRDGE